MRQLAIEMRRERPELPVIISSGGGLPSPSFFGDEASTSYLHKPFEARELADAVAHALRASRAGPAPAQRGEGE